MCTYRSFSTLLCSESEEAVQGDISYAAAYVAFGLMKIAGAFCVTERAEHPR